MNERIRELHSKVLDESGNMRWNVEDAEKFAELIVKECAITVQDFVDHRIPANEYPARLKEHFGVEQ